MIMVVFFKLIFRFLLNLYFIRESAINVPVSNHLVLNALIDKKFKLISINWKKIYFMNSQNK